MRSEFQRQGRRDRMREEQSLREINARPGHVSRPKLHTSEEVGLPQRIRQAITSSRRNRLRKGVAPITLPTTPWRDDG